jgi:hypothetical protein
VAGFNRLWQRLCEMLRQLVVGLVLVSRERRGWRQLVQVVGLRGAAGVQGQRGHRLRLVRGLRGMGRGGPL